MTPMRAAVPVFWNDGMRATIVNGQFLLRDNEPTGTLPGQLLRKKR